jgi:hypothetical protein
MDGQCLQNQREPSASQHVYGLSMCAGSPKVHAHSPTVSGLQPHRWSDSRFFDAAGDGFLVIPSFYRKVVNVPGPGIIESYGVIGSDI